MMLYDPKWEVETRVKPDIYALPTLIAWLETMPPDKEYDYLDCRGGCLLGQYFTSRGLWHVRVGGTCLSHDGGSQDLSQEFRSIAVKNPRTFGAALERARALLLLSHAE